MAYRKRRTLIDNKGESANRSDRGVMGSVGSAIGSVGAKGAATGATGARKIGSAARGAAESLGKAITKPIREEREFRRRQQEYWKKNHDPRYKD